MLCPICRGESNTPVCPHCGFDTSCQYETYATLVPLPKGRPSAAALRKRRETAQPGTPAASGAEKKPKRRGGVAWVVPVLLALALLGWYGLRVGWFGLPLAASPAASAAPTSSATPTATPAPQSSLERAVLLEAVSDGVEVYDAISYSAAGHILSRIEYVYKVIGSEGVTQESVSERLDLSSLCPPFAGKGLYRDSDALVFTVVLDKLEDADRLQRLIDMGLLEVDSATDLTDGINADSLIQMLLAEGATYADEAVIETLHLQPLE